MKVGKELFLIGIGNPFRRDDGVGHWIASRLRGREGLRVTESGGEVSELMQYFQEYPYLIVIDALSSGMNPGSWKAFEAHREALPADSFQVSSHGFGLNEAIEFARALGQLPKSLIVYGIEGKDFSSGTGLSPEIEKGANELLQEIEEKFLKSKGRSQCMKHV